jgi:hypothetical protein
MAAGMRDEVVVRTVTELNLHHRTGRAAAIAHGRKGPKLLKAQTVAKLRQEVRFELGDDKAEADHRGVPLARP